MVARLFAEHGFAIISADEVGHRVLEPGGAAHASVAARWPSVVVDGRIDRSLLAAIVFSDAAQLEELEEMTHAAIIETILDELEAVEAPVVLEVPVLLPLGDGWTKVFVDAAEELRIDRAVARGDDEGDARRRAAAQAERATWLEWADDVIRNEGSVEDLRAQVEALIARIS